MRDWRPPVVGLRVVCEWIDGVPSPLGDAGVGERLLDSETPPLGGSVDRWARSSPSLSSFSMSRASTLRTCRACWASFNLFKVCNTPVVWREHGKVHVLRCGSTQLEVSNTYLTLTLIQLFLSMSPLFNLILVTFVDGFMPWSSAWR